MPELSEQQKHDMQPLLRQMMGHTTNNNVPTASLATTTDPDQPLVSNGFFICTGMVMLYHNSNGDIEPTLLHLSSPHLGAPIRNFLNGVKQRMETEGGHVEAVFVTGGRSTGSDGAMLDPDAADMRTAVAEMFPEDTIRFHDTIKHPEAGTFGLAYVPPQNTNEGIVCVRDYETDYIHPHFPFNSQGKDVAPAANKGEGQGI